MAFTSLSDKIAWCAGNNQPLNLNRKEVQATHQAVLAFRKSMAEHRKENPACECNSCKALKPIEEKS